ncbi:MAG: ABC transporter permease [Candidatus Latescibacterota bacterium]
MNLLHLVIEEILHRKVSFLLGLTAVAVASGVLVAGMTLIDAHDLQTRRILEEKETQLAAEMARMEDEYRKMMKELGYNLLILPKEQQLDNFYDAGYAAQTMPEEYAARLASVGMVTIRHMLPSLEQKVRWPERGNRAMILVGVRGEMPFLKKEEKEPMLLPVKPGEIVLGYELWSSLGISAGETLAFMGKRFTVSLCHLQRGTKDDITAWVDLATAQRMLGKPGLINAILALKCHCAGNDIATIRADVSKTLPDTRVIELENNVVVRARARDQAKATADSSLAAERSYRAALRGQYERFTSWLAPVVILGSATLIGLLMFANVRERREEIGILRAIGYTSRQITVVFLAKAVLLGLAGALIGLALGYPSGIAASDIPKDRAVLSALLNPLLGLYTLLAATFLAAVASWAPALLAAREDPADILGRE